MPDKEMLTPNDYQSAIDSQSACNLSGIVFSFARVMQKICNEASTNGHGTDWKNKHPIAVMYAEQISHLTGVGDTYKTSDDDMDYLKASDECERMAKGKTYKINGTTN